MRGEQRRVFWNVRSLPDIGTRLEAKAKDKTLKVSNFLRLFLFSHHFRKIVCEQQIVFPDQTKLP